MTGAPTPGPDEIVLSAPAARDLCQSLEHLRAGRPAQVRVTFGELGTRFDDELWPECWHHSYSMCGPCWRATRREAAVRRPGLVIRYTTSPPAEPGHGPAEPGHGPAEPGHGPAEPGHGPAEPGNGPALALAAGLAPEPGEATGRPALPAR